MKYGNKKISKAANIVLTSGNRKEVDLALSMIDDWRALHLQPLVELQKALFQLLGNNRIRIFSISKRLKRISSILNKLDRNPNSGLGTMQDIGGLRIVVHTMASLEKALKILADNIPENFEIAKEPVNYINTPKKDSGYRSVHFVYKYKSSNNDVDGMKIELQLRTKLQHSWAMAVETAELITGTALKSSQGDIEWQTFFKVVSSLFAIKEKTNILDEHKEKGLDMKSLMKNLYQMNRVHNFNDTLKALNVTSSYAKKDNYRDGYYILSINFEKKRVNIISFPKENEMEASALYSRLEKGVEASKNAVVLVSVPQIQELQEAYPSYFLNTGEFLNAIDTMMQNCEKWGWVSNN
ncbi:MAG: RelA/SpoT domain-containing protein [Bacteroidales bacterium]|nr:RelA/SpoT domain-containing protein [Bacteroidales bacterium]